MDSFDLAHLGAIMMLVGLLALLAWMVWYVARPFEEWDGD